MLVFGGGVDIKILVLVGDYGLTYVYRYASERRVTQHKLYLSLIVVR